MAKIKVPKLNASTFRSWAFVLVAGVILAILALIDRGGLDEIQSATDAAIGCRLEVTDDQVNVRSGPSPESELLETLFRGDEVDGTRVVTDGFRELTDNRWAADQYLTPLRGTNCG